MKITIILIKIKIKIIIIIIIIILRPQIVVIDKKLSVCIIVDITVPAGRRVEEKEQEKVEKYQDLKREIGRMWEIKNCK